MVCLTSARQSAPKGPTDQELIVAVLDEYTAATDATVTPITLSTPMGTGTLTLEPAREKNGWRIVGGQPRDQPLVGYASCPRVP